LFLRRAAPAPAPLSPTSNVRLNATHMMRFRLFHNHKLRVIADNHMIFARTVVTDRITVSKRADISNARSNRSHGKKNRSWRQYIEFVDGQSPSCFLLTSNFYPSMWLTFRLVRFAVHRMFLHWVTGEAKRWLCTNADSFDPYSICFGKISVVFFDRTVACLYYLSSFSLSFFFPNVLATLLYS
jgi:hypothetical protein